MEGGAVAQKCTLDFVMDLIFSWIGFSLACTFYLGLHFGFQGFDFFMDSILSWM